MFGEDVKNVLLQHKSWLSTSILEPFSREKLDEMRYPYCQESRPSLGSGQSCNTLIVFVVGGVTYEEAKEVAMFHKNLPAQPQLQ